MAGLACAALTCPGQPSVFLHHVLESSYSMRMEVSVGSKAPIHPTALGWAIGAWLPDNEPVCRRVTMGCPYFWDSPFFCSAKKRLGD